MRLSANGTNVILGCPANEFVVLNYKDLHCTIPELCLEKKNRPLRRFATPPLTLGRKVINTLPCRGWGNTSLSSPKLGEVPEGRRGLFLRDSSCLCISILDINKCSCEIFAQRYQCYCEITGQRYQCYCEIAGQRYQCSCEIDAQRYQCFCEIDGQWYQCYCEIVAQRYQCSCGML